MKVCNQFLLGADPEFVIRAGQNDLAINLAEYILGGDRTKLGYDHGGHVGECRPNPSVSALEVVRDIRKTLLRTTPENYGALHNAGKWEAGAYKEFRDGGRSSVSLGGHLHFGLQVGLGARADQWNVREGRGIQALDKLTRGLEFLDILPTHECYQRRARAGYGRASDIRVNGEAHFEYRTLCSWLFHPETAMLVLTLGKLVMRFPISIYKRLPAEPSEFSVGLVAEMINRGAQKHADDDCKVLWEKVFEPGRKLQHDFTADFRKPWEQMRLGRDE